MCFFSPTWHFHTFSIDVGGLFFQWHSQKLREFFNHQQFHAGMTINDGVSDGVYHIRRYSKETQAKYSTSSGPIFSHFRMRYQWWKVSNFFCQCRCKGLIPAPRWQCFRSIRIWLESRNFETREISPTDPTAPFLHPFWISTSCSACSIQCSFVVSAVFMVLSWFWQPPDIGRFSF